MKISHICVNYGTPLFRELFNALNSHEIEQSVFYPRNKKNLIVDLAPPYHVDSPLVLNKLTRLSFQKKRKIMQEYYDPLFQRNKPDLIHAHTLFSDGSLANYYNKAYGVPYIVAIRSTDIDVFLNSKPWLKQYGKQILNNASYIIFISNSLKRKFQEKFGPHYEPKSLVISNGIHQSYLTKKILQEREPHDPPLLLYVGSFLKRKNVPALIKNAEKYQTRLTIAGEGGNDEKKVLKMARNSSKVNYLGRIEDQTQLIEIYRQSDIFIMLSKKETFGLVYLEAMSQGLPLIYSTGTGIDGLFTEGEVGFAIDPDSPGDIYSAIQRIISDYQAMSKRCIKESMGFSWENISNKYFEIYKKSLI